jgi:transcriptional regulator with XRE-family HTH domain
MNEKNKKARKYSSKILGELLDEVTPAEQLKTNTKMTLAARLGDLISAKGWGKSEFADKINKNPSEITKWLSGTHNFTIDTLAEIAMVLKMPVVELFVPAQVQVVNKVQVVVTVNEVEPSIKYDTPRVLFSSSHYSFYNKESVVHGYPLITSRHLS